MASSTTMLRGSHSRANTLVTMSRSLSNPTGRQPPQAPPGSTTTRQPTFRSRIIQAAVASSSWRRTVTTWR